MSTQSFIVPPRSWDAIGAMTHTLREKFHLAEEPRFPIMDFLERILDQQMGLVRFEVESEAEMGAAEGYTDPNGEFIILREDVYEDALAGDGRARFTAAHELGHLVMHTNIKLARAKPQEIVKPYRLTEPQANQFAAEILMPRSFFFPNDDEHALMRRHGVSYEAARLRVKYLKGKL